MKPRRHRGIRRQRVPGHLFSRALHVPFIAILCLAFPAHAQQDPRIRTVTYHPDTVYAVRAHVGYQIDLEFEPGETFVGLGAGDIEGIAFSAEGNHLFIKPRAARVSTNLTILTTRRHYHMDYLATDTSPHAGTLYALRFQYPPEKPVNAELNAVPVRPLNADYWYCGHPSLKPIHTSDDGVRTTIRFASTAEHPAVFVHNDDESESLLNFSIEQNGDMIIHRLARHFIVRRGKLIGCIVNRSFKGAGERLPTQAVSRDVERQVKEARP